MKTTVDANAIEVLCELQPSLNSFSRLFTTKVESDGDV